MNKYRNYTDIDVINAVKESKSIAEVLRKLNLREAGGNYMSIKGLIARLNLNTSHFTGQLWNKGQNVKDYQDYRKNGAIKKRLIKERGNKCENERCGLVEWLGEPIKLELHHIDGNRLNNFSENLNLLCPNCHSFTKNYRRRKSCLTSE